VSEKQNAIHWPEHYLPGTTDNFVSNETIAAGRVRILMRASQRGKPAADLAVQKPNPVLNGHRAWLDGLVAAARASR
jgi:hypothetical protein